MSLLSFPLLPASLLALSSLFSLSSATCYVAQSGSVQKATAWKSCGAGSADNNGIETCCLPGSECGEDMVCHIPSSEGPGDNSWYQAGCTDPTYQSNNCRKDCVYWSTPYIQYLTNEWNCCGDYGCNGTATEASFKAAAPGVLTQITSLRGSPATTAVPVPPSTKTTKTPTTTPSSTSPTTSSSSPTTSSSTTTSPTTSPTSHRTNAHRTKTSSTTPAVAGSGSSTPTSSSAFGSTGDSRSGGLSSGAKIGIGAAIGATGALAILAAIVACFVFRVKRRRSPEQMIGMKRMSDTQSSPSYRASGRQSELDNSGHPRYSAPRSSNFHDTSAFLAAGGAGAAAGMATVPPVPQHQPNDYNRGTMFSDGPLSPVQPLSPVGMAFNDSRVTRDWQSIKSSRHLSSIRTTRDYRFEDLPSRRDSIRTTRDYRFFAPEDEGAPPLP